MSQQNKRPVYGSHSDTSAIHLKNMVSELFSQMREPSPGAPQGSGAVTKNVGFQQLNSSDLPWTSAVPSGWNTNLANESQSELVRTVSNASALTSLCADLSPSDSHFFEVLYIGKVRISQRKVPDSLIDDALQKFAQHEAEKERILTQRRHSLLSSTDTSVYSDDSSENLSNKTKRPDFTNKKYNLTTSTTPLEPDKVTPWKSADNLKDPKTDKEPIKTVTFNVTDKPKPDIDQEFDNFTKERVEKNGKKTSQPLEPNVIINVPKNNLGTVKEEKHEEIHNIIKETASSITQFCQTNFYKDETESVKTKKELVRTDSESTDPLMNAPVDKEIEIKLKANFKEANEPPKVSSQVKESVEFQRVSIQLKESVESPKVPSQLKQSVELPKVSNQLKESIESSKVPSQLKQSVDSPKVLTQLKESTESLKVLSLQKAETSPEKKTEEKINFEEIARKRASEIRKGSPMPENKPFLRDRSASIGTLNLKTPLTQLIGEQNRTMLFQVGRSELRLISPDRKQILLHRAFKDVASCVLGRVHKEHFGFVCRENTNDTYACYVFKCESDSVATEVINAIRQAFIAHAELIKKSREKSPTMTCEHCPMLWYHRLCHDVEGMNEKKTHAFVLRRIEQLPDEEQDLIITKYQGGTNHMYEVNEHNSFLMMLLRAHCEAKQTRHVHDTAENRSEFLNQYLGGSTIFMKAKRSLSSGFDHLLKRRASKDDQIIPPLLIKKDLVPPSDVVDSPPAPELLSPEANRSKSVSPGVVGSYSNEGSPSPLIASTVEEETEEKEEASTPVNSPMMDIFLKLSDNRPSSADAGTEPDATWRQTIYEKVLHPTDKQEGDLTPKALLGIPSTPVGKRSKEQLRQLWKLAIDQTILLVRMERENAKLRESEESSAVRRIKLEYNELGACDAGVSLMWDSLLSSRDTSQPMAKVDRHMLTQAVLQGVPRMSRGGVWYFLAEQYCLRSAPPDVRCFPLYHAPYRSLLAGLTKHQHAILIDLGRTFPKHSYFSSALGPGQLALYNILKAYSLLDPDVGYCQGLSFVAGVLLLHMDEAEAFVLLRHLMFRRGLRKQYLPDMSALQVQLYQLSRLVRDHEPELHAKLEELDISPALYAAPWMLTLFTSQFPLGFVVRVFDLVFLESIDVVFSVSLALLSVHKDGLMLCESCEEAAEYLKHKLPDMPAVMCGKVMKKVHSLDISRQLSDYAVEYAVLREEMPRVAALTEDNRQLAADNTRLNDQFDSAMDAINSYQKQQQRLETQSKSMEQQLTLLCRYLSTYHKQEMPVEIKKIVQTYSKKLSFGSKILKFTSNEDEDKDDPKRNFKTGVSAPNLFAKISKEDVLNAMNKEKNKERTPESDRKNFMMKKSQSVHSGLIANNLKQYPLKVLEENEKEYTRSESFRTDILKESLKELGRKNTGFFANTHEQIRQERLFEQQLKHDFDENLKKLDEKIQPKSYMDDLNVFQSRKSMSLNLKPSKADSGFVTPISPSEKNYDRKDDNCSIISHPLSDCDVDIKFDGQSTKLKQIRPIRHSNIESK